MSVRPDGTVECDHCGRTVGNGGLDRTSVITALLTDGTVATFHICVQAPNPCLPQVATAGDALAAYAARAGLLPDFRTAPGPTE